jgi:protein-tyrosine phosphatase
MAEALLARHLADPALTVSSAGTRATLTGCPAEILTVMAGTGLDLGAHRSRQMDQELLDSADLVVAMAREHVREAALLCPGSFRRTFTLKELLRRSAAVGPPAPDTTLSEWTAALSEGRTTTELLGDSADDDVADPMGQSLRAHEIAAAEIDRLTAALARVLAPVLASGSPASPDLPSPTP